MNDTDNTDVDTMEKHAKFTIIQLEDDQEDNQHSKILNDAKEEITKLYEEFRDWLENNVNSEDVSSRFDRLKKETIELLERTKKNIAEFNDRENVKAGKEKVVQASSVIKNRVDEGIQELLDVDYVSKAVTSISNTVDNIRNDERVIDGVKKFKKGTLQIAQSAFDGLKRVLDTDEDGEDEPQKGSEL